MARRRIEADQRWTIVLIVAFSALLVALAWAAVIEQTRHERQEAITAAVRQNINRSIAFEQYVTRTLEAADAAMLYVAGHYEELKGTAAQPAVIRDAVLSNRFFEAVSVADARGYVVATTRPDPPTNFNVADIDTFYAHRPSDTGRMMIGTPGLGRRSGKPLVVLSRRISHPDGSFAGVAAIQMSPFKFTDFTDQADFGETDLISVIGLDGVTRARRTGGVSSYGEDLNGKRVMAEQLRNPHVTYLGASALDGIVRYFSHRRLTDYPLFVTVGISEAEIVGPIKARARKYYGGATLVTLGTIAFAWLLIAGLIRRERASAALAKANLRLREAQRVGQIGDWELDLRNGRLICSEQMYALYQRDPALGPPSFEDALAYLDEPSRVTLQRAIDLTYRTGEPQEYELVVKVPGGGFDYHRSLAVPRKDAAGNVIGVHGTTQDITAQKMVETLQARLSHMSRIDAMNTMAATLAHELNQPLTAATNYLAGSKRSLARAGIGQADALSEGIHGAERQIRLAGNIIRRIRDMVSDRSADYERAPLPEIVSDALSLIAMANNYPGITVTHDIAEDARVVTADRVQIQQVLINLVRNACDALEGTKHPEIRISAKIHDREWIKVRVADNGPGLAPGSEDLFSPFATSKMTGLGLGLPISRTIVEAHGGRIWVDSDGETGTSICFTIPIEKKGRARRREADLDGVSAAA
jgi:two-component system, LuxR family, sensor kinase FixL